MPIELTASSSSKYRPTDTGSRDESGTMARKKIESHAYGLWLVVSWEWDQLKSSDQLRIPSRVMPYEMKGDHEDDSVIAECWDAIYVRKSEAKKFKDAQYTVVEYDDLNELLSLFDQVNEALEQEKGGVSVVNERRQLMATDSYDSEEEGGEQEKEDISVLNQHQQLMAMDSYDTEDEECEQDNEDVIVVNQYQRIMATVSYDTEDEHSEKEKEATSVVNQHRRIMAMDSYDTEDEECINDSISSSDTGDGDDAVTLSSNCPTPQHEGSHCSSDAPSTPTNGKRRLAENPPSAPRKKPRMMSCNDDSPHIPQLSYLRSNLYHDFALKLDRKALRFPH